MRCSTPIMEERLDCKMGQVRLDFEQTIKKKKLFFLKFWRTQESAFCGATVIPVLNFWWRLPWVYARINPLFAYFITYKRRIPQIHLWCNTC